MWLPVLETLPAPEWFGTGAKLGYIAVVRLVETRARQRLLLVGRGLLRRYVRVARGGRPLATRRLAGAVMMIEGSIVTLAALAWLFLRLAAEGELRQELLERGLDPRAVERAVRYGRATPLLRNTTRPARTSARVALTHRSPKGDRCRPRLRRPARPRPGAAYAVVERARDGAPADPGQRRARRLPPRADRGDARVLDLRPAELERVDRLLPVDDDLRTSSAAGSRRRVACSSSRPVGRGGRDAAPRSALRVRVRSGASPRSTGIAVGYSRVRQARQNSDAGRRVAACRPSSER